MMGEIFMWCKGKLCGKAIMTSIVMALGVILVTGSNCYADADTVTVTVSTIGQKNRSDIEERYKWKLEDIYAVDTEWDAEYSTIKDEYIPRLSQLKGSLKDADTLLECLKLSDEIGRRMDKLYIYAKMKSDENQADSAATERTAKAQMLQAQLSEAAAFISPEILGCSEEIIVGYINNPTLGNYKHMLESLLLQKKHVLSNAEEELLASMGNMAVTSSETYNKLRFADMTLPKIKDYQGNDLQLSDSIYSVILENKDREYRKRAFEGVFSEYGKLNNTFASILSGEVNKNVFYAKAKKYDSALEASLAGENIPLQVYDQLIDSTNAHLDVLQKYIGLRKKVLGVDKVHLYDMYVPLVENNTLNVSFDDAKKVVIEGLKPFGSEYQTILKRAFDERWIDVYPVEKKYTGAYQWGTYDTHPYVLLNFTNTLDSELTMAHELGHAVNAYESNATQSYVNSSVPIFNAEVASTCNEFMVSDSLIKKANNDNEKLYLINKSIESIRGTFFTQVMYSEFEKAIHERVEKGDALSADVLNSLWKDLMIKYYGSDFEADDYASLWWSRIPHFYMDFYVYKYATAIAASNQLVDGMVNGEDNDRKIEKYLEFLKAGSSDYSIETLKKAGVDMTTSQPVDNLIKHFDELVNEMENILHTQGKI